MWVLALWLGLLGCGALGGDPDTTTSVERCTNGADDDGNSLADCDGSCPEQCDDGRDNDLDGEADCEDSDCDGLCVENCEDGRDNDGDGNDGDDGDEDINPAAT